MYLSRVLTVFLSLLLLTACSENQNNSPSVRAKVTNQNGQTLSNFSLQLINAEDTWTGKPYKAQTNNGNKYISASISKDQPVVLKFSAPGYQPLYTFLKPVKDNIEVSVKLGAPAKVPNAQPVVIGSFNGFDSRSGKKMTQQDDGSWTTQITSGADTIRYSINRYIFGSSIAGTKGDVIFREKSRGVDASFVTSLANSEEDSIFHITFDPSAYEEIFQTAQPAIQFSNNVAADVKGTAKVYTLMIQEYWNMITARSLARLKGEKSSEYDFSEFLNTISTIENKYTDASVAKAIDIAKFRLLEPTAISVSEAETFLKKMSPNSPIWLMHFPVLTSAVNRAGLENSIDNLTKIINQTPYSALRGEALYNRLRYYYNEENESEWHSNFTRLVSNHPEHYRTTYAYKKYAPEQPIVKGEPLIYDSFNGLEEGKTVELSEIKESYLLIDFWATWCGPCIESLPNLKKTHQELSDKDFTILNISLDENPQQVKRFRNNEITMPWYHAHEKRGSKKVREMGIVGIPHYVLLGPDRKVITNNQSKLEGDSLTQTLRKHLNPNKK